MKRLFRTKNNLILAAAIGLAHGVALVIVVGAFWGDDSHIHAQPAGSTNAEHDHSHDDQNTDNEQFWTCSMHPQIRRQEFGLCPICNMDLVPVDDDGGLGEREISFSAEALALMDVETVPARRRFAEARIRLNGKIAYDERRVKHITAWVGGRIDRMFVDFTGMTVRQGDHMVEIYSPDLLSAQAELLQAVRAVQRQEGVEIGAGVRSTLESARRRLRLMGLQDKQIQEIERTGQVQEHLTLYAPIGGVVIERKATEGLYVNVGDPIFQVADLSQMWVELDVYESDLMWLQYGQEVDFTTAAFPGEVFTGRISFIDPRLDDRTRTVRARVDVPNPDGKLRPAMFVRGLVRARVAHGGRVMEGDLAGKWISPMHPSVIKDGPGQCDVCGMDLVPIESLGYAAVEDVRPPLIIPVSAPLITGKRAVVYVRENRDGQLVFEGREVVLGPRAGDYYLVESGLEEGEDVVVRGNFKIDSALQIQAKVSMMSYEGGQIVAGVTDIEAQRKLEAKAGPLGVPSDFRAGLADGVKAYLALSDALADDEFSTAQTAAERTRETISALDMDTLGPEAHDMWMGYVATLNESLNAIIAAEDIEAAREAFYPLSYAMIDTARDFWPLEPEQLYVMYCPMAFDDQGAHWLSGDDAVRNPYFGAMMYRCGEVAEQLFVDDHRPEVRTPEAAPAGHDHH